MAYRVAITDGWRVNGDGMYLRHSIAGDCGHNHQTAGTAEKCLQKLLNWSLDGRHCSARWYNATVLEVDTEGQHIPPERKPVVVDGKPWTEEDERKMLADMYGSHR